jgi:hypothetical protein
MARTASDVSPDLARTGTVSSVRFFFFAQVALLIAVLVGFSPTFYLRPLFKVHPLPAVLYLHGAVLTVWFMLTALQGWLVQTQRFPVAPAGRVRGRLVRGAGGRHGAGRGCTDGWGTRLAEGPGQHRLLG